MIQQLLYILSSIGLTIFGTGLFTKYFFLIPIGLTICMISLFIDEVIINKEGDSNAS